NAKTPAKVDHGIRATNPGFRWTVLEPASSVGATRSRRRSRNSRRSMLLHRRRGGLRQRPEETVSVLRDWGCHVIAGNCEEQLAAGGADCGCGFPEGSACDRLSKG